MGSLSLFMVTGGREGGSGMGVIIKVVENRHSRFYDCDWYTIAV